MINAIRSIIFNFCFIFGGLIVSILLLPTLLLPTRPCVITCGIVFCGYINFIEKYILGLTLEIEGLENVPKDGKFILAPKHQSAFETMNLPFMKSIGYPVIVLKKELTYLPVWGLFPKRVGFIAIDRGSGTKALRQIIAGAKKSLAEKRGIIIFPQGTRVAPGARAPYKAGLAKIYKDLHVPIVPVALNSGVFWGRNAFFKKPGVVTYRFLPPIEAGLPPREAMKKLEEVLEKESDTLVQAAGGPALAEQE